MSGSEPQAINYPDILGIITGGERHNISLIQCAITTRPDVIAAGQSFEVLLLIQNAADSDIDVMLEIKLPDRDADNRRGMFFSKSSRLLVGLQPAEVGYITLPASCSPKTSPSADYHLLADIKVDRVDKAHKPQRIREANGGGDVTLDILPAHVQEAIRTLGALSWSTQHASSLRGQRMATDFEIRPPGLSSLKEFKPDWVSLWTLQDHLDEKGMAERIQEHLDVILPHLADKHQMFKVLYTKTNQVFKNADYALQDAEAVFICKLLTLVLAEVGVPQPSRDDPNPTLPKWYRKLVQLLFQENRFREFPERVVAEHLYFPLLADSIPHAFRMVETVRKENFGTAEDVQIYTQEVVTALRDGQPLSYGQVYFPMIVAGVIANTRVTMPNENVRESLNRLYQAMQKRQPERNEDNAFVTDMLDDLIDTVIENF
ncbi:MAG: hypothetical protein ACLFTK_13235 [Anaerolineales bacterium]